VCRLIWEIQKNTHRQVDAQRDERPRAVGGHAPCQRPVQPDVPIKRGAASSFALRQR
jgi:hypothetical protein